MKESLWKWKKLHRRIIWNWNKMKNLKGCNKLSKRWIKLIDEKGVWLERWIGFRSCTHTHMYIWTDNAIVVIKLSLLGLKKSCEFSELYFFLGGGSSQNFDNFDFYLMFQFIQIFTKIHLMIYKIVLMNLLKVDKQSIISWNN